MQKRVVADIFETLGQTVKQAGQKGLKVPGDLVETAAGQIGIKPQPKSETPEEQKLAQAQKEEKKQQEQRRLDYLEAELKALQQKKAQEIPKQISGKPGFSEEKAIKQIELEKENPPSPASGRATEEQGKKEQPLVVAQAKKKGGTSERKFMGASG